ncbi:MAG TPA: DUF1697 domain-containing protein [Vicinamibacterales bacterium]|nr:DUF1697 domain-containing protein [Vicinamibacterales bacterium]
MPRYVAFLRAINVGGHVVKMDRLRQAFTAMRFSNVATFIASGNVIFESPAAPDEALETRIETALEKELGYDVATFVRSGAEVTRIAACEAYKASELGDAVLYIGLLKEPLAAREKKIVESLQSPVDQLRVDKREIYWRASKSFRDAIFSPARLEKALGQAATFRNANTFRKLAALFP